VRDLEVLAAALLHDTLEDTDATPDAVRALVGDNVLTLVLEVTDDKSLPKQERKQRQIEHAAHASPQAKLIKLADKISNVYDLSHEPPAGWSYARIVTYLDWSEAVVSQIRGTNPWLEAEYDRVLAEARIITEEREKNALS
ncbi:MAG: bifunctional (p)ppGpp synthetase/guanosine-3',5'-bis(diphosphate) 3'-pyrophosphohydrolase, partial [Anaerolineales bacterium]